MFLDNIQFFDAMLSNDDAAVLEENELSIFPNPNNGSFWVKRVSGDGFKRLVLYDSLGRMVWEKDFEEITQNYLASLNHLSTGIYFLQLTTRTALFTQKVLINK